MVYNVYYIGYSLDGPDTSNDTVPVQNTTRQTDFGSCYLSCPFNDPENSTGSGDNVIQPCYYAVNITQVIKGNYSVINFSYLLPPRLEAVSPSTVACNFITIPANGMLCACDIDVTGF